MLERSDAICKLACSSKISRNCHQLVQNLFKKKINNYLWLNKPQIKVVDGNKHKTIFLSLQKYQQCSVFICQETKEYFVILLLGSERVQSVESLGKTY